MYDLQTEHGLAYLAQLENLTGATIVGCRLMTDAEFHAFHWTPDSAEG